METQLFRLLTKLVLIWIALVTAPSFGQTNAFRPLKMTCAAIGDDGNPFGTLDFDVLQPSGQGSHSDVFPKQFNGSEYPYVNYRVLSMQESRFRVSAEMIEHVYSPGQYVARLSVYEELPGDKLVLRSGVHLPADTIRAGYRMVYDIPKSNRKVICHSVFMSARKGAPPAKRVPASKRKSVKEK